MQRLVSAWISRSVSRFLRDESGATAIEYCLIATGIAFAIIGTVQAIGPQLSTKFTSVNNSLK
jgi:pilus assembly protein Flp/PilA